MWPIRLRFLVLALASAGAFASAAERQVYEAIMIRVNDKIVSVSDFRDRVRQELAQLPEKPRGSDLRLFSTGLLKHITEEMVLNAPPNGRTISRVSPATATVNSAAAEDALISSARAAAMSARVSVPSAATV